MGFFSNIVSATIKTALSPVAVVKDVVNITTGEEVDSTKNLLSSATNDAKDALDDLSDGEI
jgi:enhancing lycopene biosynthesis protein 2